MRWGRLHGSGVLSFLTGKLGACVLRALYSKTEVCGFNIEGGMIARYSYKPFQKIKNRDRDDIASTVWKFLCERWVKCKWKLAKSPRGVGLFYRFLNEASPKKKPHPTYVLLLHR